MQPAQRAHERQRVLRGREPADCDDARRVARVAGAWRALDVDRVRDHDGALGDGRSGPRARRSRSRLGHADGERGQRLRRAGRPIGTAPTRGRQYAVNAQPWTVKIRTGRRRAAAAMRPSTPALELLACTMSGRSRRIRTTSSSSPRRSRPGCSRAPDVAQRRRTARPPRGRVAERAVAVGGDDDLEAIGEAGQQLRHVGLRPAGLGQRDEDEDPRHPASVPRREA